MMQPDSKVRRMRSLREKRIPKVVINVCESWKIREQLSLWYEINTLFRAFIDRFLCLCVKLHSANEVIQ